MEDVATFELVTKVDEARHLAMLWARMVEAEMRADLLEVELAGALE